MVTADRQNDDDTPTHDALGTDLRRVAAMREAGYSERQMAQVLATTTQHIRYAVMVLTDDRDGCPSPEEIDAGRTLMQSGWTLEQFAAAKRGEPRISSSVVRDMARVATANQRRSDYWTRRLEEPVESMPVPVYHHPEWKSALQYEARVSYRDRGSRRVFATHEEAEAWGRAWLLKRHAEHTQARACVGR